MAIHNEIGKIGEDVACSWLIRNNFLILDRNYRRKWGEIDIVAHETNAKIRFIEVKTVSYETKSALISALSRETWNPADKVHYHKQKKLLRIIETWIAEHSMYKNWQIDIAVVFVVPREKYAQIRYLDNIVFE